MNLQLPLVVCTDTTPEHYDVLVAAGIATVALCHNDTTWAAAIATWRSGLFRKVVRRAKGVRWERVTHLEGVTVTYRSAQVRALPPVSFEGLDTTVRKLQVAGTDFLPHTFPTDTPDAEIPTLWLTPHVCMTTGKAAAQVSHLALLLADEATPGQLTDWRNRGYEFAVREASVQQWDTLSEARQIVDAGFTEIAAETPTVRSVGLA